ncbi:endo-1,4-beta-xylanase [Streptomyces sp. TRM66268-LWL]|uniref:Beta-xylanase n=1 Tax=Streptomyces polyasparticus TaxID=2767826 RepID=A0ABR7SCS1_9ACTN|nr:endo-1,4-beta-xylanase [Streptomyces polyasparticus]MBC9712772.1 endo-1,4-beta-xylanase [Streptomyces polyasparticus]
MRASAPARRIRTRSAVVAAAAAAALLGSLASVPAAHADSDSDRRRPARTLHELARESGRYFGSAVDNPELADTEFAELLGTEFGQTTPGNGMKWYATEPERGVFDFTAGDEIVDYAKANGLKVRGHTLLWHSQLPAWLSEGTWTKAELRSILKNHITQVVKHYKGKVFAWDVANEIMNEDGTYRENIFYKVIGPGYIADALRWARAADPKVKLYLNDYNVEALGPKSDAYYTLIKQLKKDRVPIDGFGLQAHLALQYGFPGGYEENLRRFADLGVDVSITELDIRMQLPADEAKLAEQADWYGRVTEGCLEVRRCVGITLWGYTDRHSWIPDFFPGEGAALPWDENLRHKPAYDAIREELAEAAEDD